ncbi:fungal-specific transcription factor domain-containing protein [Gloeopeniophorella convolvens]|nr:fungal-specific transcription factor domain-containing protein [Gloeopeniophorella convolvens]
MNSSDPYLSLPSSSPHHALPRLSTAAVSDWSQSFLGASKRRNVERACDECRRRKTRCDGPKMPDNVCTNCVQSRKKCTYVEASKPRGPPKAYVTSLEDRVERMEALLKRLRPEIDFSAELGPPVARGSWKNEPASPATPLPIEEKTAANRSLARYPSLPSLRSLAPSRKPSSTSLSAISDREHDTASDDLTSDEEGPGEELLQKMKRLTLLDKKPQDKANRLLDAALRYHGSSTTFKLVSATRELRSQYLLESMGVDSDVIAEGLKNVRGNGPESPYSFGGLRREEYWRSTDWELAYEGALLSAPTVFSGLRQRWPSADLAEVLIDLYFFHCNSMFPLLHRPTFRRHYEDKLYERDMWFAATCMGVFALASRYIDDPRVLLDELPDTPSEGRTGQLQWQTAGFKYYFSITGVEKEGRAVLNASSLFEIQTLCLMAQFQSDTRWHRSAWYTVGLGIRKMQDIGAHSKRSYAKTGPSTENELWKRVWWYLTGLDRIQCATLGRSCAVKEEDFDAEYPLEVDDDFWENENPQLAFQQPADKPSVVAAFNLWLRLTDFAALAMHSFDIIERNGPSSGLRGEEVLSRFNENLTQWTETVPDYLKWSPDIEDAIFANQSATLYTTYNLVTILMQRAFLPPAVAMLSSTRDTRPAPSGLTYALNARAVAVNAAKASVRILSVVHRRALSNIPLLLLVAEVAAGTLCTDGWIIKSRERGRAMRGGQSDPMTAQTVEVHIQDVTSLLRALRWAAPRWETAQEKISFIEKAIPNVNHDTRHRPTTSATPEVGGRYLLSSAKFPQQVPMTPIRPDLYQSGYHASTDTIITAPGPSRRPPYPQREDDAWLADAPYQFVQSQHAHTQVQLRKPAASSASHLRGKDNPERPPRSAEERTRPHAPYLALSSILPTLGQPYSAPGTDYPPELAHVKREPDADSHILALPQQNWAYEMQPLPQDHTWENGGFRDGQHHLASAIHGQHDPSLQGRSYRTA